MSIKHRIKKLEERRGPEPCASCGGRIIYEEHHEDGSVSYPEGDMPCSVCRNAGWGGAPGVIVVCAPLRHSKIP